MKPLRLLLLLMALLGLFLLSSCGKDNDNDNNIQFDDWNDYWNYAQDREFVLFAHIYDVIEKDGMMGVYLWADKVPDNMSSTDTITMSVNGEPLQVFFQQEGSFFVLYSYSHELPTATSITVEMKRNGTTVINKSISVPAKPEFTSWDVNAPDEEANLAWTVPANSGYQVLEFWAEYLTDEDYVTYFLNPAIRSKTIPANTLALAGYENWDAYISANFIEEDANSTLISQTWDDIEDETPSAKEDILARIKAMHRRKVNR